MMDTVTRLLGTVAAYALYAGIVWVIYTASKGD